MSDSPHETTPATEAGAVQTPLAERVDETDFSIEDIGDGYAGKAWSYKHKGFSPIPIPAGQKWPPPSGYTGRSALEPSGADIQAWCEDRPSDNIAIALPPGVIGIDVDDYVKDGKQKFGGATIAKAVERWGALPDSPRSTSRPNDLVSGIRLYRVPEGVEFATIIEIDCSADVEVIQPHHRYAVVGPSIREGRRYGWYDDDGNQAEASAVDELPWLPDTWIEGLRREPVVTGENFGLFDVNVAFTEGDMHEQVATRLAAALAGLRDTGSRYDNTRNHSMALMRLGRNGLPGVHDAVLTLGNAYVAAVEDERGTAVAVAEYKRMLFSPGAQKLLAEPSYQEQDEEFFAYYQKAEAVSDHRTKADEAERPKVPLSLADRLLTRSALRDLPKPEPLIANVLDRGTIALLYGYWGTCKTFIALDWAACVATSHAWQGRETGRLRVLYVAAEGAFGIAQRLDAWETAWRMEAGDDALAVLPAPVNLTNPADLAELIEVIREGGYGFVIIDTAARCMVGADENSARDIGIVVDALSKIREATPEGRGVALAVHHTGKDGKTLRGSSAFEAGADTVYQVTEDGGVIVLDRTKRKDGPKADRHELRLSPWPGTQSCVIEAAADHGQRADVLPGNAERVLDVFKAHFKETGSTKAQLREVVTERLGMGSSSFHYAVNDLLTRNLLHNNGSNARPFLELAK